jgi:adenylate kinase
MNLVSLYGKPLTGKGTQAGYFVQQGFFHLPMGDYMREQAALGDPECQAVISLIDNGDLVPDELPCKIVARIIDEKGRQGFRGVLLDGFPRTLEQAEWLDAFAEDRAMPLKVVELQADDNSVLNARRLKRINDYLALGKTPRPEDLDEDKFWKRLRIYDKSTARVADHYEERGQLIRVPALQTPLAVWHVIRAALGFGSGPAPQPGL